MNLQEKGMDMMDMHSYQFANELLPFFYYDVRPSTGPTTFPLATLPMEIGIPPASDVVAAMSDCSLMASGLNVCFR